MASKRVVSQLPRQVKPILSLDRSEARRRALNLYRSWWRQIPYIVHDNTLPVSEERMKEKLRELFMKNKDITDIRVIDMLVIKGQMDLNDTVNKFQQPHHMMAWFKQTEVPKPKDFISKFLSGHDAE